MIQVETDAPVFSNAIGDKIKSKVKSTFKSDPAKKESRVAKREERRSKRKAKRNATKLRRLNTPKGSKFTFKLKKVNKQGTKRTKRNNNGTIVVLNESDIVSTPKGDFDKIEVAKALNVAPEKVTPELVAQNQVVEANGDVSIIVPDTIVGQDNQGDSYLAEDLQDENSPPEDVVKDDEKKRGLSTTEKVLLFGGIGVAVLTIGIILYRKFSNKGK
jgi:hypothetical protein